MITKKKASFSPFQPHEDQAEVPGTPLRVVRQCYNSVLTNRDRLLGHILTHTTQKPHKELNLPVSSREGVGQVSRAEYTLLLTTGYV